MLVSLQATVCSCSTEPAPWHMRANRRMTSDKARRRIPWGHRHFVVPLDPHSETERAKEGRRGQKRVDSGSLERPSPTRGSPTREARARAATPQLETPLLKMDSRNLLKSTESPHGPSRMVSCSSVKESSTVWRTFMREALGMTPLPLTSALLNSSITAWPGASLSCGYHCRSKPQRVHTSLGTLLPERPSRMNLWLKNSTLSLKSISARELLRRIMIFSSVSVPRPRSRRSSSSRDGGLMKMNLVLGQTCES
mmetsp:Transcript_14282/g.31016  ORF Transcript_14282/g.31016 Transcript_14282/m.31016 type:complete len:253 (+) Transcript_14282:73-831(+)